MIKSRITTVSILFCALFCVAATLTVSAEDYYWNVASGNWSLGSNWTPTGPPAGGETFSANAHIDNGGIANIDIEIESGDLSGLWVDNGIVNQSNQNVYLKNALLLGRIGAGNVGVYNLDNGMLDTQGGIALGGESTGPPIEGLYGSGYFNMTSGTINTALIVVGDDGPTMCSNYNNSYGEFHIASGVIDIYYHFTSQPGNLIIGRDTEMGNGVFNQTGGDVSANGYVIIGFFSSNPFAEHSGRGIYNMSAGTLVTGMGMCVGSKDMGGLVSFDPNAIYDPASASDGRLSFTGGRITVGGSLYVYHANSYINDSGAPASGGGTLEVWHDFRNYSHARTDFDLRHTTVIMHGGTGWDDELQDWDFNILDMNSWDVGASVDGLDINFAIGNLVFSGSATGSEYYRLESDIYCFGLSIEAGALIDLNGYNIYYMPEGCGAYSGITPGTFQLSGMWGNMEFGEYGDVIAITDAPPVPEPGTIMLIGSGILALAGVIRKRIT